MKKGFFLSVIIALLVFFTNIKVFAFNVVDVTEDFYVNDYANILTEDTKKYIMEHSINLDSKTKAQIVVLTVKDLDGASIDDYSITAARKFEIGDKEKNNGILFIVSVADRKVRIEVGYGLEGLINDAKAGRMLDSYVIPYLREDDWDNGILNGYKAIYKELNDYYELNEEIDIPVGEEIDETEDFILSIFSILLIGKVMYTIILLGVNLEEKKSKLIHFSVLEALTFLIAGGSYFVSLDFGAIFLLIFGTILNIVAINVYLESSGTYYGGGSSGGHYHGGGHSSGGFHGGGGSFGGGGASRGF